MYDWQHDLKTLVLYQATSEDASSPGIQCLSNSKFFGRGGGQTWGAGTGVLFKMELEEFGAGRSQVLNTM